MDHTIKFEFIEHRFDYQLPLLNVDLDFVVDRKAEVIDCMEQLAKKVSEINIASKEGVADFSKANDLVKYYFYALATLNDKQEVLSGRVIKGAPNEVYTGKLSQGKYTR